MVSYKTSIARLKLTSAAGKPCDFMGNDLPDGTPPPARPYLASDDFSPFHDRLQFEFADFFYRKAKMSASKIDEGLQLIAAALPPSEEPPLADHNHCYELIDDIKIGGIPWKTFTGSYNGTLPDGEVPSWMTRGYDVWFRCPREIAHDMIGNPDFAQEMDYAPKRVYEEGRMREYQDFMSGNWAWGQAVSNINILLE